MNSTRQDSWTKEEDVLLAETVLHYIREGKTQLEAFKKVGKKLGRTSAACGFRWNATIRKRYEHAIVRAKEERKKGMNDWEETPPTTSDQPRSNHIDTAILLLKEMKYQTALQHKTTNEKVVEGYEKLKKENEGLKKQISRYEEAWNEMGKLWNWIENPEI
ncbi:MAG TPA: RsfA family transcriptional regulator [Bacillota bacterium]|nr:RsfA family transcriptional regulator [Bacillota bacterium]